MRIEAADQGDRWQPPAHEESTGGTGELRPASARGAPPDGRPAGGSTADPVLQSVESRGRLRVLVVDDHPVYRDGLRMTMEAAADMEWVGEAESGEQAVDLVESLQPQLVLMDVRLPGMSGIEATRRILAAAPSTAVVVLSMLEDDDSVFAAMRAGARGYLLKGADRAELLSALRSVALGEVIFGAAIARRVMAFFAGSSIAAAAAAFPELTDREREILERIARADSNDAIARTFGLSEKTVRNHVSNILNKLQVADRAAAIVRARDSGLGTA
jgi:DNA-binding NarL/FixJ family response regulator